MSGHDIKKYLLTIPGISPLTFSDESLFRALLPKDTVRYYQSWLYTMRVGRFGTNELGFKCINNNLIAIIGFRNNHLYITPIFDDTQGEELYTLCQTVRNLTKVDILLRKIEKKSYPLLKGSEYKVNPTLLEDDAYPETILQLPKLFVEKDVLNPAAFNLIRKIERFEKNDIVFSQVSSLKSGYREKIDRFFAKYKEKKEAYANLISYLFFQKNKSAYKVMLFLNKEKEVEGLYVGEILSFGTLGLYCAVTSQKHIGQTEWMDVQFFKEIYSQGIKTVFLGGSEDEGVNKYVKKLLPYETPYAVKTIDFHSIRNKTFLKTIVRHAEKEDFPTLIQVYKKTYNSMPILDEKWTDETIRELLTYRYAMQEDLFFVVENDKGHVIGGTYAILNPWWDGYHLSDLEIFLDPSYQRKRIGGKLLLELIRYAHKKYKIVSWDTIVHTANNHPLGWFKRLGFKQHPKWIMMTSDVDTVLNRLGKYEGK